MFRHVRMGVVATAAAALIGGLVVVPATSVPAEKPDIGDGNFEDALESLEELTTEAARRPSPMDSVSKEGGVQAESQADPECLAVGGGPELQTLRYSGPNRYETAVCVSFWAWFDWDDPTQPPEAKANVVVLARGDNFPDALAGGPLAAYEEGPLLLTPPTSLPASVMEEIQRVLAPGGLVYLLGGTSSVSNDIRDEIEAAGYDTTRLAGANRYETALEIARELPATSNFFFATGQNFPDALAAGTAASALSLGAKFDGDPETRPFAVLLTQDEQVPQSTIDFVFDRDADFGGSILLTAGGTADRAAADAFGAGSLAARFAGSNRYDTAAQIGEGIFTDVDTGQLFGVGVGLATGLNFPDALAATPYLANFLQPLLLTRSSHPSSETVEFLENHAGEGDFIDVFGGTSTVSDDVVDTAWNAFQ